MQRKVIHVEHAQSVTMQDLSENDNDHEGRDSFPALYRVGIRSAAQQQQQQQQQQQKQQDKDEETILEHVLQEQLQQQVQVSHQLQRQQSQRQRQQQQQQPKASQQQQHQQQLEKDEETRLQLNQPATQDVPGYTATQLPQHDQDEDTRLGLLRDKLAVIMVELASKNKECISLKRKVRLLEENTLESKPARAREAVQSAPEKGMDQQGLRQMLAELKDENHKLREKIESSNIPPQEAQQPAKQPDCRCNGVSQHLTGVSQQFNVAPQQTHSSIHAHTKSQQLHVQSQHDHTDAAWSLEGSSKQDSIRARKFEQDNRALRDEVSKLRIFAADNIALRQELMKQNEEMATLRQGNATLREDNGTLREDNETLREENETLREENETLREENETLREENETLREENETIRADKHTFGEELALCTEGLGDGLSGPAGLPRSGWTEDKVPLARAATLPSHAALRAHRSAGINHGAVRMHQPEHRNGTLLEELREIKRVVEENRALNDKVAWYEERSQESRARQEELETANQALIQENKELKEVTRASRSSPLKRCNTTPIKSPLNESVQMQLSLDQAAKDWKHGLLEYHDLERVSDLLLRASEVVQDRDHLVRERDDLVRERDDVARQRDNLARERNRLFEERDAALQDLELARDQLELARAEMEAARALASHETAAKDMAKQAVQLAREESFNVAMQNVQKEKETEDALLRVRETHEAMQLEREEFERREHSKDDALLRLVWERDEALLRLGEAEREKDAAVRERDGDRHALATVMHQRAIEKLYITSQDATVLRHQCTLLETVMLELREFHDSFQRVQQQTLGVRGLDATCRSLLSMIEEARSSVLSVLAHCCVKPAPGHGHNGHVA